MLKTAKFHLLKIEFKFIAFCKIVSEDLQFILYTITTIFGLNNSLIVIRKGNFSTCNLNKKFFLDK